MYTYCYRETINEGKKKNDACSACKCIETPTDLLFCAMPVRDFAKE